MFKLKMITYYRHSFVLRYVSKLLSEAIVMASNEQ